VEGAGGLDAGNDAHGILLCEIDRFGRPLAP